MRNLFSELLISFLLKSLNTIVDLTKYYLRAGEGILYTPFFFSSCNPNPPFKLLNSGIGSMNYYRKGKTGSLIDL
ncbi:MAG: hypothetical protein EAX86_02535 [Candidatus Heimdallarchaeota archaeon]|nr:hypothetical protein [Candidatus Heimdallarchaeota archaeon]